MPDKKCACPEHDRHTTGVTGKVKLYSLKSRFVPQLIVERLGIRVYQRLKGNVCESCLEHGRRVVGMSGQEDTNITIIQESPEQPEPASQQQASCNRMTDSSCSVGTLGRSTHFTNLRPSPVLDPSSGMNQTTEPGQPTPARRDPSPIALALRELGILALPSVVDQTSQLDDRGEDVMDLDPSPSVDPPSCANEASQQERTPVGEAPEDLQTPDLGTAGSHDGSEGTITITPVATPMRPRSRPSRAQRVTGAPSGTPKATWTTSPRAGNVRTPMRCRLWKGDLANSRKKHRAFVAQKASQMAHLRREHAAAKTKWKVERERLETELSAVKRELVELRRAIGHVLTDRQVTRLLTNKSKQPWDEEDIVRALSIRCVSLRCYRFLRDKLHFPLPGLTTLRTWTRAFQTPPGLLDCSLKVMRSVRDTLPDIGRYLVLSFDEMAVDQRLCYDSSEDRVYGPCKNAQVVMVRGLCSHWKQPVFFDFDQPLTRDILFAVISAVEKTGFQVVATVCDLSPPNRNLLWYSDDGLKIRPEDGRIQHPCDPSRHIYTFADIPHMVKLMRNHIMDQGMRLGAGDPANKSKLQKLPVVDHTMFVKLLGVDDAEFRLCHKLTMDHVTVRNQERQRVAKATETLSETVGRALLHCFGEDYRRQAEFVIAADRAFDVFNSHCRLDSKPYRCGFGVPEAFEAQYDALLTFTTMVKDARVGSHRDEIPFQRGFVMSSNALRGLYSELCQQPGADLSYLLTSRLTQDFVENFFSQVRGMGGSQNNPTPSEFKTRVKLLLMGANPAVAAGTRSRPSTSGASVAMEEENPVYLSAEVLGDLGDDEATAEVDDLTEMEKLLGAAQSKQGPAHQHLETSGSEFSRQGLAYVAGYLAYKLREVDGGLGKVSSELPPGKMDPDCEWLHRKTRGGLCVPSPEWLQQVKDFDVVFCAMHGHDIDRAPGVISRLRKDLELKYPHVDKRIVKKFAVTRTHLRLKWVQRKLKRQSEEGKASSNMDRNAKRMRMYHRAARQ